MKVTKRGVQPSVQAVLEQIREQSVTEANQFGAPPTGAGAGSTVAGAGVPKPRSPQQAAKQVGASVQGAIAAAQTQQAKKMGKPDPKVAAKQSYEPQKSPQERQRDADFTQDVADVLDKDKDGKLDPEELPQPAKPGKTAPVKKPVPTAPGGPGMTEDELDEVFAKPIDEGKKVTRAEAIRYGWTPPKKEKEKKKKETNEAESIKQRKMREPEPWEDPTKEQLKKKKALISANPKGMGVLSSRGGGGGAAAGAAGASEGVFSEDQHNETLDKVFV